MSLRRIFLLGAAGLVSLAALVAIGTVLDGNFGETEGKIFATIATTFVAGSTVIAGLACLGQPRSRALGFAGIVLASGGFALWTAQIWGGFSSDGYWKLIGVVTAWALAVLFAATASLMTGSPRLARTLLPATAGVAAGAALVATVMLLRENGDGWQLFAVLLILALLGEALIPILERYAVPDDAPAERLLGIVGGAEVIAVRGRCEVVRIGEQLETLRTGESVLVRER
jgi:hypothetical protein